MELRFQGAENRWNERGIVKELFNGCDVENDAMNKLIFILWVRALLHILKGRHRYRRSIATSVRQRLSVVDRKPNIDQTAAEKAGFYSVITTSSLNKTLPPLPRISISSQSTGCGDISRSKMVEPTPYILVMKVLYDYTAQADDELSISEDALVFLLDNSDEEWSKVQSYIPLDQVTEGTPPPSGLVPAAYVEEATPIARATALYDYEATGEGEVSMKEDTPMSIYAREDEWILVKLDHPGKGKLALIGYVPANYVEENDSTQPTAVAPPSPEETPEPKASALPAPAPIAVPPPIASLQPSETVPVSHSSHVAATTAGSPKSSFDPIQTWSVSEIDGKGKKKKGTLGVGNAAIFFASESDKAPVQQWPSSAIVHAYIDSSKHKHVVIELSSSSEPMVFGANSKDTAEAIIDKIDISRDAAKASTGQTSTSEEPNGASTHSTSRFLAPPPSRPNAGSSSPSPKPKGVHWDPEPPSEIRRSEDTEYEDDGTSATIPLKPGEVGHAVVLYDFVADGEDELTVNEGEKLVVVDKEGSDEWWKCRSASGKVGVVPASYVDLMPNEANDTSSENDRKAAEETRLRELEERRERERQEEAQKAARAEQLKKEQQREQREQAEREKQIREQERQHQREVQNQDRQWAAEAAEASNSLRERVKKESNSTTKKTPGHSHSASKDLPGRPSLEKPNPNQTRVWHDRSGQFKVEAEFLGVHNGKVRLHKMNGVVIEVPEEKMSTEDMQIIERLNRKGPSTSASRAPPKALSADSEDNIPLGQLNSGRRSDSNSPQPPRPSPPPKKPGIDWFEFFLSAGCDLDDCTRYAHSFEREKMDEAVLPDLKADSLRALGLREGDIIRVLKKIEQKDWKVQRSRTDDPRVKEQVKRDEELAMQLQRQEYGDQASRGEPKRANTTSPSPGLFAGPQGALRNNTRRGRPTPTKSTTLAVDPSTLSSASDQLSRGGSPSLVSPSAKVSTANGASKPTPVVSGFDDDAWAPRPTSAASNKPSTPAPTPATTSLPPPAPPVPAPSTTPASAPAPALAPSTQPKAQEETPAATQAPQQTSGSSIQRPATTSTPGTSLPNEFDNLAKLGSWRPPSAPAAPPAVPSISPPPGFQSGMGMGANPTPIGSLLVAQQTGVFGANMPRGPLAPVPANEGLLRPLIPTNTGFSSFIPTRPGAVSSPPLGLNSPNYLIQQPTGASPLQTIPGPGFSTLQPHMTGVGGGMLGGPSFLQQSMPSSLSPFANPPGFQHSQLQSQPTGFAGLSPSAGAITNPGSSFISNLQSQPPAFNPSQPNPTATQSADTNPANVFASMKAGSFANNSAPQASDKYDALRPATAPQAFASQPTGWSPMGVQSQPTGFQPSMLGGQIGYQQTGLNQPGFQHGGGFPASNFGFSG
ncbi:cytoskeletal protein binding protein [Tulasnella sp. 418]|nr:cytoskeletal protein binding protein [Tulasnella sp. 418]